MKLTWYDWRVVFFSLKSSRENYDHLGKSDLDQLWLPQLIFSNCATETSLKFDEFSSVVVKRNQTPMISKQEEIYEDEIFQGDSNPFVYKRSYELDLECNFGIQNYPFDYEECFIEVRKGFPFLSHFSISNLLNNPLTSKVKS